ncbi:glycosyl hydrolase 115 family protein [Arcticibacter eurypsychrophilus]|uniref:glycosyl hydrolase 115 family protein n=1 Tax=Arcticibacter eurypsychrophilus TaxID=1434752 RepID=UPI00084D87C0|nr:glycosyl hydrolase 115 family protein [Arcticibacter eurypsychrophilus]
MIRKISCFLPLLFMQVFLSKAADTFVSSHYVPGSFSISSKGNVATLLLSDNEWEGVNRAARDLASDLQKVTGITPEFKLNGSSGPSIIIGTIGKSKLIDQLIKQKKINVAGVAGQWESNLIQVVYNPIKGVDSALVIAGSDKRGTIYGIYELSYQIGVSPWYYWADVPVKKQSQLYALGGRHITSSPVVKYRGIFLNDEAPALSGWAKEKFGGFNHQFYEKVFELILRLKGNYLWPAMWGNAFNDDDLMNSVKADEYGIVMGTSHHEPLMRAHAEWKKYGEGLWNYDKNETVLKKFWKTGLERTQGKEQIVTVGMRGDGDEPMTTGTATSLLERIVRDQRSIIEEVSAKPASASPQLWALYKEVQDYYDQGMRVPDDVTLLLSDDNWGNLRKLPKLNEAPRSGGYGIYYHFDYVGGPRNYKWINTNPIQKIWEQMNLAYEYDANKIWIVNVGDLKPMEFPIEFFLDYAWTPSAFPSSQLKDYTVRWCSKQFGDAYAVEIANILDLYTKYNGRVKPELLNADTYSLVSDDEYEGVVKEYEELVQKASYINEQILPEQRDAYYQLILHPVIASANLYALYYATAKNRLYAKQGRNSTNEFALKVKELFQKDADITNYYNHKLANGKWNHMMDQTHIGYKIWQQPATDTIPRTDSVAIRSKAMMGLSIEGSESYWSGKVTLNESFPIYDNVSNDEHYFEIFNRGGQSFTYQVKAPAFFTLSSNKGTIKETKRICLSVDWTKAPAGEHTSSIQIKASDGSEISIPIRTIKIAHAAEIGGFVQNNRLVSMEAVHYSRAVEARPVQWQIIPGYGKTAGGVFPVPVTSPVQVPKEGSPHLEYDFYVSETGPATLSAYVSPTIDFANIGGLKYAISIDDGKPVVVNINKDYMNDYQWGKSVANSIKILTTPHTFTKSGKHVLNYWMINPGIVLQKLVIDFGGLKSSFLGPKETFIK